MKRVAHIVEETRPAVRAESLSVAEPRRFQWTVTDTIQFIVIGVLAAITRFIKLGDATDNGTPVFDEKHYVPQAWDIVTSTDNPIIGGIESNPAYGLVVHPPLAKQLLALGEMVYGYTPLGWRVMTALFSTLTVLGIVAIARRLSHSPAVAAFAGILALADGVLLVAGRFGMLDIFLTFFVVAATYCFVRDHQQMRQRMYRAFIDRKVYHSPYGPRFGYRWWRFTAGVFLGCALGVKWSGLYYIAFFGVMTVLLDLMVRRQYRIAKPVVGTLLRDCIPAFASVVVLPIALYLWSWRAWFAGETSVYRHAKESGSLPTDKWYYNLPDSIANWFYYHDTVLQFHASLTSSSGHSHPWDSKPWSWLVASRPVLYYSQTGQACGGADNCRRMIYLFGAPTIWWLTVPVVLWALWCLVIRRDCRFIVPLVGFAASFIPWLIAYDRQMYFFYAIPLVPFTILMLALTLGQIANSRDTVHAPFFKEPLQLGKTLVIGYLALVIMSFVYWGPIYYGTPMTDAHYNSIMWLRSWR